MPGKTLQHVKNVVLDGKKTKVSYTDVWGPMEVTEIEMEQYNDLLKAANTTSRVYLRRKIQELVKPIMLEEAQAVQELLRKEEEEEEKEKLNKTVEKPAETATKSTKTAKSVSDKAVIDDKSVKKPVGKPAETATKDPKVITKEEYLRRVELDRLRKEARAEKARAEAAAEAEKVAV